MATSSDKYLFNQEGRYFTVEKILDPILKEKGVTIIQDYEAYFRVTNNTLEFIRLNSPDKDFELQCYSIFTKYSIAIYATRSLTLFSSEQGFSESIMILTLYNGHIIHKEKRSIHCDYYINQDFSNPYITQTKILTPLFHQFNLDPYVNYFAHWTFKRRSIILDTFTTEDLAFKNSLYKILGKKLKAYWYTGEIVMEDIFGINKNITLYIKDGTVKDAKQSGFSKYENIPLKDFFAPRSKKETKKQSLISSISSYDDISFEAEIDAFERGFNPWESSSSRSAEDNHGLTDDTINSAFEKDPENYWNID